MIYQNQFSNTYIQLSFVPFDYQSITINFFWPVLKFNQYQSIFWNNLYSSININQFFWTTCRVQYRSINNWFKLIDKKISINTIDFFRTNFKVQYSSINNWLKLLNDFIDASILLLIPTYRCWNMSSNTWKMNNYFWASK